MGVPYFKIKSFLEKNKVSVFSSNFSLYTNISDRVMKVLAKNCPEIEVYSIDEAFCDFSGISGPETFALNLKNMIFDYTSIPVSVGIGPTKVLAKVANLIAKKSQKAMGIVNLTDEKYQDIALKRTPIGDVWGIGRASTEKLKSLGIKTAYDFKNYPHEKIIKKKLTIIGLQIQQELRGVSCFPLKTNLEAKKEIMCSRSFGKPVGDLQTLKEAMAYYISQAAEKMRRQDSLCTELAIFARTNPFSQADQFYIYEKKILENPTGDTRKLVEEALGLLEKNYRPGFEYTKAGVLLSNFFASKEIQLNFFYPGDSPEDIKLMSIMDQINLIEGDGSLVVAACLSASRDDFKKWQSQKKFCSPRFTTSWQDLPKFH